MKNIFFFLLITITSITSFSQEDTLFSKTLTELVVTATRTERKLSNVAVPVQIISRKAIVQSGSVRLNDILSEQTGLYITSGGATTSAGGGVFGNGIQIQGLSPDYTLILLDGEPIIGRQGGVIDLSRLAVGNIKKIEIVKGPSSSLYGSEAMGGVVNIITEQAQLNRLDASFRYGRFNSTDANLSAAIKKQNWGLQLFGNRNSSNGFDLDENAPGKTVDPFSSYTTQARFNFFPSAKTKISVSGRYYNEKQDNYFLTQDIGSGSAIAITGDGKVKDMNLNPVITRQFNNNLRSSLRFYFSRYEYEQTLLKDADKSPYYYDFFQQDFYRAENQTDFNLPARNFLSVGAGIVEERLNTTRYAGKRSNDILYAFLQDEWRASEKLTFIGGLRYDDNSAYQSRVSPKLAAQFKVNDKLRINASYGAGFKAPDFRQLFLNFLNTAAGGYVVYGANEITISELESQKQQGILSEILPRAYDLALLKPEISKGLNAGVHFDVNEKLNFDVNLFRNDIDELIQVDIIAFRINAAPVYSYFNVKEAYTQGAEINSSFRINNKFQLQGGYQFLMTADKADLERIENGEVYTRDLETNEVYKVQKSDYGGLPNRSKHMANAKLFYENTKKGWSASVRAIYKSRWGTYDKDGNGLINREDEFASGSTLININAAKTINAFRVQAGIDNLFNYKDELNLPGQPGIQPYISIHYSFIKNKNNN
ncbi:MAG TPA: TonB-dependent receptor [Chitinophagaceae bacterium]